MSANRARISSSERASISGSSAFASSTERLDASDLAVVRVDESGKELHGTAKYRGRGPRPPSDGLSARSRCRTPRRGSRRSGAPARPRTRTDISRDVGSISGFLRAGSRSPGSWRPQRGDRSWSRQWRSSTGRGSRPPSPSGRCSCRLIGLPAWRPAGRLVNGSPSSSPAPPSASSSAAGVDAALAMPSSHRSISWVRATSLENSAPTDSPRWMRLMASPMSGATESVVILGIRFRSGSGIESVRTTSRSDEARDPVDGRVAQDAVGGAGVDLGDALALERADDLDRACRRCRSRRRR